MKWYMIFAILIVLISIFGWWIRRPIYYCGIRLNELKRFIRDFISQSTDGSTIFIELEESPIYVQFIKHCANNTQSTLSFVFPDTPWSRKYFDELVMLFEAKSINYTITDEGKLLDRYLEINTLIGDIELTASTGFRIVQDTFKMMGLDERAKFQIHFKANLSTQAAVPALEQLSGHPSKLVQILSKKFLKKHQRR
ncbi:MAG: hypothetical protein PHU49_06795 [Syntrophorhabdaceae bacterium]|nr:hypothetical protein [Syntrophorhabdaceae bacterium]MDD5243709.1 hypothetical protein [Syntrophorhabdaceae bacterium]